MAWDLARSVAANKRITDDVVAHGFSDVLILLGVQPRTLAYVKRRPCWWVWWCGVACVCGGGLGSEGGITALSVSQWSCRAPPPAN